MQFEEGPLMCPRRWKFLEGERKQNPNEAPFNGSYGTLESYLVYCEKINRHDPH